ncbi:MAG: rod-binding protein [Pseudomonadota bacterium]
MTVITTPQAAVSSEFARLPDLKAMPEGPTREEALRKTAVEFETLFLAEMLKHAGLGSARESFGGGAGEEAFSGLLAGEQARLLAERGGIGLADRLFESLLEREGGDV